MSGTTHDRERWFGKYRGTVVDNRDPRRRGRIRAAVPDVLGENASGWALPCVPVAGDQAGTFFVPAVGASVWVEFERGEPDHPIWAGGFWGSEAEVPPIAMSGPDDVVVQTSGDGALVLSAGGSTIVVDATGVFLRNAAGASVSLVGPTVDVNDGGLTVA